MVDASADPLARAARWQALRSRVREGAVTDGRDAPPVPEHPVREVPVRELAEAARQVLERHPDVSITITVEAGGGSSTVRFARTVDGLTVTMSDRDDPDRPGSGPAADRSGTAARLAEVLRRDPTRLFGGGAGQ
jgi:hypothetical protein